jgi:hypothetical protein
MNDFVLAPAAARTAGVARWLREGLRAAFFLAPRTRGAPHPRELLVLAIIATGIELVLGRLEVPGPADFSLRGWLAPWWGVSAAVLLLWTLLSRAPGAARAQGGVAAWFALWLVACIPPGVVAQGLGIASAWELLPEEVTESSSFAWGSYLGLWIWMLAIAVRLGSHFGLDRRRLGALGGGLALIFGLTTWEFPEPAWAAPVVQAEAPRLVLSDETFDRQQALFQQAVAGLAPQRPGVTDVYGIVFAPYAREDVFLRESALVAELLEQRFDAQGRVLQLVNHVETADELPWATPRNLKRAIDAIAERMDRENDLLVVYLTSHGARDFKLAAAHPPLKVEPVSPGELRAALDDAGIRYRVVAISACYSGGWIGPLAGDTSLVMTAADADHTSYGCGALSELTFFGRALFGEQLRKTHSFEEAFAAAVPVIRQREIEAGKPDGFSNPQISVGERIRPFLKQLEQRLARPARSPEVTQ